MKKLLTITLLCVSVINTAFAGSDSASISVNVRLVKDSTTKLSSQYVSDNTKTLSSSLSQQGLQLISHGSQTETSDNSTATQQNMRVVWLSDN